MSNETIRVLRRMSWERVKGDLHAIHCTFSAEDQDQEIKYSDVIEAFIDSVEFEGLVD